MVSDYERINISLQQYKEVIVGEEVKVDFFKNKVGYVSEINHKNSGEDSYVVTDIKLPENPTEEDLAKVKNITIFFQGSTFDLNKSKETWADWGKNNFPMLMKIFFQKEEILLQLNNC